MILTIYKLCNFFIERSSFTSFNPVYINEHSNMFSKIPDFAIKRGCRVMVSGLYESPNF